MTTTPAPGLGETVRRLRRERNLSQPQLADKLGVSVAMISQIELGKSMPGVPAFIALAEALGVSFGVLFGEPLATAEHLVAQVREQVHALGFDIALIPLAALPARLAEGTNP